MRRKAGTWGQDRAAGAHPHLQKNPRSALEVATRVRHTTFPRAKHREQVGSSQPRSFLTSLLLCTRQSTATRRSNSSTAFTQSTAVIHAVQLYFSKMGISAPFSAQIRNAPNAQRLPTTVQLPGAAQFPLGPTEKMAHNCRKRDSARVPSRSKAEVLLTPALPPLCPEICSQAGGFASFLPSTPGIVSSLLPPKHSKHGRAHSSGLEARTVTSFQSQLQVPWQTDLLWT